MSSLCDAISSEPEKRKRVPRITVKEAIMTPLEYSSFPVSICGVVTVYDKELQRVDLSADGAKIIVDIGGPLTDGSPSPIIGEKAVILGVCAKNGRRTYFKACGIRAPRDGDLTREERRAKHRALHRERLERFEAQEESTPLPSWYTDPLKVIYNAPTFAVVVKPQGLPTQGVGDRNKTFVGSKGEPVSLVKSDLTFPISIPSKISSQKKTVHLPYTDKTQEATRLSVPVPGRALIKAEPVHRLDSATGGVLLLAKTKEAVRKFATMFATNQGDKAAEKHYRAICFGDFNDVNLENNLIDSPVLKKDAQTIFNVLKVVEWGQEDGNGVGGKLSLVDFQILTGRTHQIRKHCLHVGHPILGDFRYGPYKKARAVDSVDKDNLPSNIFGFGWSFHHAGNLYPIDHCSDGSDFDLERWSPHKEMCLWSHSLTLPTNDVSEEERLQTFACEPPDFWSTIMSESVRINLINNVVGKK